ncbi:uncharacterized protein APUU_70968A [Aspergillus puulaauensis]|uniref:Secreted protein n=1 Tax=Aspergillus puulaauensis TaxID=1220207 RepID=A0A7R7XYR4_9EURO|nr:uncharacterized protein APUU_70968A [Aspergillus puulaauensis]BCS29398.1 hypothetical protein APUU_70968A [Aspergillus puulaauensis]
MESRLVFLLAVALAKSLRLPDGKGRWVSLYTLHLAASLFRRENYNVLYMEKSYRLRNGIFLLSLHHLSSMNVGFPSEYSLSSKGKFEHGVIVILAKEMAYR